MKEPKIEINGWEVTPAMAMIIRFAIENFSMDLNEHGLGDDDFGDAMKEGYLARIDEIRQLMAKSR